MSSVAVTPNFPIIPTAVEICTSRKRHSFCDLTGSVLFFLGSPLSNVASTIADANYLGYAIEDIGKTYTKAMEIFSELTKTNINTDTLYNLGRSFTVHIGNFVSNTSDAWKFLVTCRLATAWSGLAIAGGVLGIYSKSVESYDIYNQTIEPLKLPEETEDQNEEVSDFINLVKLNRNIAVIIDSDKTKETDKINATKERIRSEINNLSDNAMVWVTQGREIENYVPSETFESILNIQGMSKYTKISNLSTSYIKVDAANQLIKHINKETFEKGTDLNKKINELVKKIHIWNK